MATREENLKKINDELEKLSDEELEQVSGGSLGETADDSRFLNVLMYGRAGQCDRYGKTRIAFSSAAVRDVKNAWAALGIEFSDATIGDNSYKLGNYYITRQMAWEHAEKVCGRHLERKDWDW